MPDRDSIGQTPRSCDGHRNAYRHIERAGIVTSDTRDDDRATHGRLGGEGDADIGGTRAANPWLDRSFEDPIRGSHVRRNRLQSRSERARLREQSIAPLEDQARTFSCPPCHARTPFMEIA